MLYLGKSRNDSHSAQKIQSAALPESEDQKRLQRLREREDRKSELEFEIVVARLNAELTTLKKTMELGKKKSTLERLEEDYSEHDAHVMAVCKIAKREKQANVKKYADDPELLEQANLSVDNWLKQKM